MTIVFAERLGRADLTDFPFSHYFTTYYFRSIVIITLSPEPQIRLLCSLMPTNLASDAWSADPVAETTYGCILLLYKLQAPHGRRYTHELMLLQ